MPNMPGPNPTAAQDDDQQDLSALWPEATAEMLDALTEGLALMVPTRLNSPDAPGHERSQEALTRLSHDPEFQKTVRELVGRFARSKPDTVIDADGDLATVADDRAWGWMEALVAEADKFAGQRRFPLLAHADVALVLVQAVTNTLGTGQTGTIRFRGSAPLIHINPLADRSVSMFWPRGRSWWSSPVQRAKTSKT